MDACNGALQSRLISLQGEDLRQRPLEERRKALAQLIAGVNSIQFSASVADDGAIVFDHACQMGLEGIVSKRAGSQLSKRGKPQLAEVPEP
jgi:bifunctional non-homologous end joining protein LigD